MSDCEWNDEQIARLRKLWDQGVPTIEIAQRLGISKNAVCGKASRLNLTPRPSPIHRCPDGTRKTAIKGTRAAIKQIIRVPTCARDAQVEPTIASHATVEPTSRHEPCQWPDGCGHLALTRRPYCQDHTNIAILKPRN